MAKYWSIGAQKALKTVKNSKTKSQIIKNFAKMHNSLNDN